MSRGRILIVEDHSSWRETLKEVLEGAGYVVRTAQSAAEARVLLESDSFHLLVLDIRLEDSDEGNVEGMDILRDVADRGLNKATRVIMLSAYGTAAQMREAFRDHRVSDFISKNNFDDDEFLSVVNRVFSLDVRLNPDLEIHWQDGADPERLSVGMTVGSHRVKRGSTLHRRCAEEITDLLRKLFSDCSSILVKALAGGRSGALVLQVRPFRAQGAAEPVIVKLGDVSTIRREENNFGEYVRPFLGSARTTYVLASESTAQLGGIVYSLVGGVEGGARAFGEFFDSAPIDAIKEALDDLVLSTCRNWYANLGTLRPCDLAEEYVGTLGLAPGALQEGLKRLRSIRGKHKALTLESCGGKQINNPIPRLRMSGLIRTTYVCPTHGDLNESNVFVDDRRQCWLIDFEGTGPGHVLRDLAKLEVSVRVILTDEADLEQRLALEERLSQQRRFSEVAALAREEVGGPEELRKIFLTCLHLRRLAADLVRQNPGDDFSEYQIALLYNAINLLRFTSLGTIHREHALVSASVIATALDRQAAR